VTETPLSTPLSHLLVAFTIEFDNEFERRFAETGLGRRFGVSMVMWSNFLRFVGEAGITVGDLPAVSGIPKAKTLSMLGGMERWRYVFVTPGPTDAPPESKRDGYGSARGLRSDWVVRPTPAGLKALEIWPPLLGDIERRWEERFGAKEVAALRRSLAALVGQLDVELPEYLPIVGSANGMKADVEPRERRDPALAEGNSPIPHLSPLLPQVLLAYTLDLERDTEQGLPVSANFLRVLDEKGMDVRELPFAAGVSSEATSMALRLLTKTGHVVVETKVARLTPKGRDAQEAVRLLHDEVEKRWNARFGAAEVRRLRTALDGVLEQRDELSQGLKPHPDGWRASKRYVEQTNAVIADPLGRLPHYPMVLHRGGWPDGS
jgi:DNA-binding MarR family transcriptional regulator